MRRILIDNARRKRPQKRGGDGQRINLDEIEVADSPASDKLLALDEALDALGGQGSREGELVKLALFLRPHTERGGSRPWHLDGHRRSLLVLRTRMAGCRLKLPPPCES